MRLYLLKRIGNTGYDETAALVVRARSIEHARKLAVAGDDVGFTHTPDFDDPAVATCKRLTAAGEPGVVLQDFRAG